MRARLSIPASLAAATFLAACSASRHRFAFDPAPASFRVEHGRDEVWIRGLVSVLEGRREEDGERFVLALRLENAGAEAATLVGAQLVTSGLARFGDPDLAGVEVAPGQTGTWEVPFPYPPEVDFALPSETGLHLRLFLEGPTRNAEVEVGFARTSPLPESDSAWRWSFGFGVQG